MAEENIFIPYEYVPVIDSTVSGFTEKEYLTVTFCIPKTDTVSTGVVVKIQNPITGTSLLKDGLLYIDRNSFIEETTNDNSTLQRFKVQIANDEFITSLKEGNSYQCWVRMTQVKPEELQCEHEWSDWEPIAGKQHRRICPRCGKKEIESCRFEKTDSIGNILYNIKITEQTHKYDCWFCNGNGDEVEHDYEYYLETKERHVGKCTGCSYSIAKPHNFNYENENERMHKCVCWQCDNKKKDGSIFEIFEQHIDKSTINENGEEISQNPDGKCDLCTAEYRLGEATFIAADDNPTQLNKIIISGSVVKEIIIPAEFKTIASNVIAVAQANATEEDIQAAKNGIESIVFARDSVCSKIEDNAFGYCENLKLIDLPDTIKTIGQYAFTNQNKQGAKGLEIRYDSPKAEWDSITKTEPYVPAGATLETTPEESQGLEFSIQSNGKVYLTGKGNWTPSSQLVIPKYHRGAKVTKINSWAFKELDISTVYIPSSLQIIEAGAFTNCTQLAEIRISSRSNLKEINAEAFRGAAVQNIDFLMCPKLEKIGESVFRDCIDLKKVNLPSSITEIHSNTFALCKKIEIELESVSENDKYFTLDDGSLYQRGEEVGIILLTAGCNMKSIAENTFKIASYAFAGRILINNGIRIPDSVIEIEDYAFYKSFLVWVRLPSNITTLNYYTFANSEQLIYIENLSVNINHIAEGALAGCTKLKTITYTGLRKYFYYPYDKTEWPNGTTKDPGWDTGSNSFRVIYKYKEPQNYTVCSYKALDNIYCEVTGLKDENLTPMDLSSLVIPFEIDGKLVKSIASQAFARGYNIENLVLPETLEIIGNQAFYNMAISIYARAFLNLNIPSSVTQIGNYAFAGDAENFLPYRKIKFGFDNDLETIGDNAFYNCSNVFEINFGEYTHLKEIGNSAFYNCQKLWDLEFPYSLQTIGASAFAECLSLEAMFFPYDNNIDENGQDQGILLKYIGDKAFYHCDVLTRVFLTPEALNTTDGLLSPNRKQVHKVFERSDTFSGNDKHKIQFIHYTGDNYSLYEDFKDIFINKEDESSTITISNDVKIYTNWGVPNIDQLVSEQRLTASIDASGTLTLEGDIRWISNDPTNIFIPRFFKGQKVFGLQIGTENVSTASEYRSYGDWYIPDTVTKIYSKKRRLVLYNCALVYSKHSQCNDISLLFDYDYKTRIIEDNVTNMLRSGYAAPYEWIRILTGRANWVEFKENDLIKDALVLSQLPDSPSGNILHFNFPEDMKLTTTTAFSLDKCAKLREFIIPLGLKDQLKTSFSASKNSTSRELIFSYSSGSSSVSPGLITVVFEYGWTTVFRSCFQNARPFECYLPSSITTLDSLSFYCHKSNVNHYNWNYGKNIIYYDGTRSQWEKITKASDAFNPDYMPTIVYLREDTPQTFRMIRNASTDSDNNETPVNPDIVYEPYESLILTKPEGFSTWSKASILNVVDMPKTQIDPVFINAKNIGILSGLFSAKHDSLKWYQIKFDTGEISDRIYPKKNNVFDYAFTAPDNATSFKLVYMTKKGYYATIEEDFVLHKYTSNVTENNQINITAAIEDNAELGSLDIKINIVSEMTEDQLGHLFIERASAASQFTKWETLRDLWLNVKAQNLEQSFLVQDLFTEPGVPYKYRIQFLWNEDTQRSNIIETEESSILTAEDVYLTSKDLQMRVCYDARVSGVKRNVSDSITATLGSKYPVVRRNGKQDYVTFTLSGLISYNAEKFTSFDSLDIVKMEDSTLKENLPVGDTKNDLFKNSFFFNTSSIKDYYPEHYQSLSRKHQELILEKIFRDKVMDFLYGDDIKLFKSITEGNKLVRLTNVTFTPNEQLGRNIYSFSATATEVADYTLDNCRRYLLPESEITFSSYDYDTWESGKIIEDNVIDYYLQPQEILGG